jgi:N-hydroxyarylamine O-acetyltransferase
MKTLNLAKYFETIQLKSTPNNNEDGLFVLQSSQLKTITFENIDCLLDRVIHTDIENLQRKIFTNQRGGYCFELNGLLSFVLNELNFQYRPLLARVMYRGTSINSKTHVILLVNVNGKEFITDVGFGGPGSYMPIPFEINREDVQTHGVYRLIRDDIHGHIMQKKTITDEWFNVYAFNLDQVYPADLSMSNFFTSTFPESHFRHNLIMARHLENGRITVLNNQLTTVIDGKSTLHTITTNSELLKIMNDSFGVKPELHFDFSDILAKEI